MPRFETDAPPAGDGDTRPLGALFRELSADASTLVRQEMALAKAEMSRNVRTLAGDLASMAVWGVVAILGGLVLVMFLVLAIGDLLDNYWLGALVVGLLFVAAGGVMAFRSMRHLRAVSVTPENTVETLRDTQAWAKAEATGFRAALAGDGAADGTAPRVVNRVTAADAPGVTGTRDSGSRGGSGGGKAKERSAAPKESLPKRVWAEFKKDDVAGQAAKVTYYFFMSLPPALMAVFALTGIFGGAETAERISAELRSAIPGEAAGLVDDFVSQVVMEKKPGLLSIGLLLAIWSASNVFSSFADTLNVAYGVEEDRSFVKKKLVALGTMVAVAVLFLAGSTALLAGPKISDALGLGEVGRVVWGIAQWPLAFVLISSAFWIIYYVLPNKDQSGCRNTLFKASMAAAALWLLATLAFRLYVTNFSSYSATYGFIGGIIVLLLWMYVTSMMVLVGGEIASEMEEG